MWYPESVSTTFVTWPGFTLNAASSNSFAICPRVSSPMSPPSSLLGERGAELRIVQMVPLLDLVDVVVDLLVARRQALGLDLLLDDLLEHEVVEELVLIGRDGVGVGAGGGRALLLLIAEAVELE